MIARQIPRCPWCKEIIAKGVYRKTNPHNPFIGDDFIGDDFIGDDFIRWEYLNHKCTKKPKI